jgi:hypothetical protein
MSIDFFEDRTSYWTFDEVVKFILQYFDIKKSSFRIGDKLNTTEENQNALIVLSYAKFMWYTFEQTKALFWEHDHFAIAIPESRKDRNIFQLNKIYVDLLSKWYDRNIRISDFPQFIDIPDDVIIQK